MGLFHSTEAYLGVDIGASGIKLVELHKTKGRPQLWTYGIVNQPLDIHIARREKTPEELALESRQGIEVSGKQNKQKQTPMHLDDPRIDEYAQMLQSLLKNAKTTTKRVTASLPVSYVFHTVLTLPFVEEKKRESIIRAEIAKIIDRPVDQMQVVHQLLNKDEKEPEYLRILVTAAPREVVAFYSAIFQKAGLQLEELETEAFALERSLVGHDKATSMVIDIGSERTNFFIIDNGIPVTHRSIQVGGDTISGLLEQIFGTKDNINTLKQDVSRLRPSDIPADLFTMVTGPIIKEVEYGFDLFLRQSGNEGKRPEKIILSGGSAAFPLIKTAVESAFNMRVFVGDPWARIVYQQGLRPVIYDLGPRMAVSLGLALRNIVE